MGTVSKTAWTDTLLDKAARWLVGLAVTLDIKFHQPDLFEFLCAWSDDDPYEAEESK